MDWVLYYALGAVITFAVAYGAEVLYARKHPHAPASVDAAALCGLLWPGYLLVLGLLWLRDLRR